MKKLIVGIAALIATLQLGQAQNVMTPELLWKLGRVSLEGTTPDGQYVLYGVKTYVMAENKGETTIYKMPVAGGEPQIFIDEKGNEANIRISADGKKVGYMLKGQWYERAFDGGTSTALTGVANGLNGMQLTPDFSQWAFATNVKMNQTVQEKYNDLPKTNARIIDDLLYRHWDSWEDEFNSHVFIGKPRFDESRDIMENEHFDCPQMPFGGSEDFVWRPDGKMLAYVCKKSEGKAYATSTNTDIYLYKPESFETINFTEGMMGYDQSPQFSPDGKTLAWLSMARDGYESDKNDIVIADPATGKHLNLTKDWDETVHHYIWAADGKRIWFVAGKNATQQIFELTLPKDWSKPGAPAIRQLTKGMHNYGQIAEAGKFLVGERQDMNHANELYRIDTKTGEQAQLTHINDKIYASIAMPKVEERWITTTDNKKMLVWVILPPNFDATKKYPALLYCQGGPQSAVSQFYSFRWNFQVMASEGYVVVAPNRRGLPTFGVEWNEAISKDWGGQAIKDYLTAIDSVSAEPYVDKARIGAVGASYGGYSVYMLAGVHNNRFKTFISHCGLFNLESWYGLTEELFFANWDIGGPYWDKANAKAYSQFNPMRYADKWNTPILVIHGGHDYRVPENQGMEAFQLAQLKGLKSRMLYFPEEGHWVLQPQNALLWHREFFSWLKETL